MPEGVRLGEPAKAGVVIAGAAITAAAALTVATKGAAAPLLAKAAGTFGPVIEQGAKKAQQMGGLIQQAKTTGGGLIQDAPARLRVASKINQRNSLSKEASRLTGRVQNEVNSLVNNFLSGNRNPGLGTKHLSGNIYYLRGREGGRVFFREVNNTMQILGKATKANEQTVINLVLEIFR